MPISRRALLLASLTASIAGHSLVANAGEEAPEFAGLENWINSEPLTIRDLRGKVVLVDFWTFGCSNCVNTLPWLVDWHQTFSSKGLRIVGVHTPEFPFERELDALKDAVARHGIAYPVAQDNRYRTWMAYGTRFWPTSVLVDRSGQIVRYHEGDRGLVEFGKQVAQLVTG